MSTHISLDAVSLRFRVYRNKHPNLKDAVLHWLGRKPYSDGLNEVWALRDVNLSFSVGDRIGIIGRNGAGKSSLLRVISGIYKPTSGTVMREGFLVPLLRVGLGFSSELTGRENIIQAGAMLGIGEKEMVGKIEPILAFAELTKFADTPIKYYSTGMTMRLAFTTATEVSPEILILDEVFAGGDLAFHEKALRRMEDLIERTEIVIMVSHQMRNVSRLSTRVLWVDEGKVIRDGPPGEVVAAYEEAAAPAQKKKTVAAMARAASSERS